MNRITFLEYPADNLEMHEALHWILSAVKRGDTSRVIAVTNANKLWQASRNRRLSDFLRGADMVLPEYAVVWGAQKLGLSLNHIGGIMLLKAFIPFAAQHGLRPYFLGAKEDVVSGMVGILNENSPELRIAGFHHGYLNDPMVKAEAMKDLADCRPDILFIAMGSPKQEYLMMEIGEKLRVPVLMGVGGSFDVLAGQKQDAPKWARSKGLEWLYRISQDPLNRAYWKRYLVTNSWFIWRVYRAKLFSNGL